MKKKCVRKWTGTLAFALVACMLSGSVMAEEADGYVKGDITGDGCIGIEDVVHSYLGVTSYLIPSDAILPEIVELNRSAYDVDGNGKAEMQDVESLMKAVAGMTDWGIGTHKVTASDKADVAYRYDGEYVIAYVKLKKWLDTAVVYDNTKVSYEGMECALEENVEEGDVQTFAFDNKEAGYVDVISACPFLTRDSADKVYGVARLKFKKLDDSKDISFASCTGAGYILDNKKEDESFAEAAVKYETVQYKNGYIISEKVSLEDAKRALKVALKIVQVQSGSGWNSDVNGDGQTTLDDAQKYLRLALKLDEI